MTATAAPGTTLTPAARSALINARSSSVGAKLPGGLDPAVIAELVAGDLIGPLLGLTLRGSITRERAVREALDAAF